ncbi:hypothetical protein LEP1GSC041_2446 [Leptospira noguchii str. 2006001870]|nr:hypothetical protein LEP1GSC041_2446 [Leptospira noguchii str. 2006001870]
MSPVVSFNPLPLKQEEETWPRFATDESVVVSIHFLSNKRKKLYINPFFPTYYCFNPLPLKQEEETVLNRDMHIHGQVSIHFLSNKRKKQRLNRVENNVL